MITANIKTIIAKSIFLLFVLLIIGTFFRTEPIKAQSSQVDDIGSHNCFKADNGAILAVPCTDIGRSADEIMHNIGGCSIEINGKVQIKGANSGECDQIRFWAILTKAVVDCGGPNIATQECIKNRAEEIAQDEGTNNEDSSNLTDAELDECGKTSAIADNCIITKVLVPIVNFLSAGVGIVIVIIIVMGGIQYITSEGNPQRVSAAKLRVFNAVIALLLYIFMFAIIQWLIPGGIFN